MGRHLAGEPGLRRGWAHPVPGEGVIPGSGVFVRERDTPGQKGQPGQRFRGVLWLERGHRKVSLWAVPGRLPREQEFQEDGPGLLTPALRGDEGGAGRLSRGPGRAGADQRATGAPAGFPRRTAGAGVASGSRSGGRLGKAGVSGPSSRQEHQPINLQSPREMLRGFAFCLANYSASTLFLSWGALALCRSLIKRKPLSQLPQGWGNQ